MRHDGEPGGLEGEVADGGEAGTVKNPRADTTREAGPTLFAEDEPDSLRDPRVDDGPELVLSHEPGLDDVERGCEGRRDRPSQGSADHTLYRLQVGLPGVFAQHRSFEVLKRRVAQNPGRQVPQQRRGIARVQPQHPFLLEDPQNNLL